MNECLPESLAERILFVLDEFSLADWIAHHFRSCPI